MANPYTAREVERVLTFLDASTEVDPAASLDATLTNEAAAMLAAHSVPPVDRDSLVLGILAGVELARRRPPG